MANRVDDVVSALYDAYNRQDAAAATALYAPQGRHVEIAMGNERTGPDAIREGLEGFLTAFPDANWAERARMVGDGRAAVTYVLTATLQGRFGPFEPKGQPVELRGVHVIEVGDDGITVVEDYWDAGTFMRQVKAGSDT